MKVIKRDNNEVEFDTSKIANAILAAGKASGELKETSESDRVARIVVVGLHLDSYQANRVSIETIQDYVENTLIAEGYLRTARAYIVYREQRANIRKESKTYNAIAESISEYLDRSDWRVSANANQGYSLGGLILNSAGKMIANYWLNNVYPPKVGEAHRNGDMHIHDLDFLSGYCAGWSLKTFLQEGMNGVPGKIDAAPPKHFSSAIGQVVNFLGTMQNEWAGAQAFSSFDTYMAPYVRKDNLAYESIKQGIQELVYNLNTPSRWGGQPVFSNLTFDWVCPEDLHEQQPLIGGKEMPFCYGELQTEMDMINRAYIEVMTEGDYKGRIFTFPIPTYNITHDFPWDSENANLLFEMTAKYGLPYFQNFIGSDLTPNMVRSMCPLDGETLIEYRSSSYDRDGKSCWGVSQYRSLVELYNNQELGGKIQVITPDGFRDATVTRQPMTECLKVKFSKWLGNSKIELEHETIMGINHLQPIWDGADGQLKTVKAKHLKENMAVPLLEHDGVFYAHIKLEPAIGSGKYLYCVEIENETDFTKQVFVLANNMITHNCRLQLDLRELLKRGNGLFGSAEQTGSLGVVTINCARLGYLWQGNVKGLYAKLDVLLGLAKDSLEIKRKVIQKHMDNGLFPYTKRYLGTLRNHFSTIGVNGINEMIRNFTGDTHDITTDYGHTLAVHLLDHVRQRMVEFQESTGHMYNLEATPAEGTTYRFAREDQKRYPDILQAGTKEAPYYTNSSQLPVGYTGDAFEALEMQEELQAKYTGGTVLHLYMGERMSGYESCKKLVRRALEQFRIPYMTISPTFSICPIHGYLSGEHEYCPKCDEALEATC